MIKKKGTITSFDDRIKLKKLFINAEIITKAKRLCKN